MLGILSHCGTIHRCSAPGGLARWRRGGCVREDLVSPRGPPSPSTVPSAYAAARAAAAAAA
eukprot:COSAG01_NODE_5940_length_3941_cov_15.896929_5_plen_60_part_01